MPDAAECVRINSSWVRTLILTCDNELAIEFHNGFCCVYPGTTEQTFNLMLVWASKGKFLHRFLIPWPYKPIKNRCPAAGCGVQTECMINPVARNLVLTITCPEVPCLDGISFPITYDPDIPEAPTCHSDQQDQCSGGGTDWQLFCTATWELLDTSGICISPAASAPDTTNEDPFELVWLNCPVNDFPECGSPGPGVTGTIRITR